MSLSRRVLSFAIVAAAFAAAPSSRADDTEDRCLASSLEGQVLERAGRLERAHQRFVDCGQADCQAAGTRDRCLAWAKNVAPLIPRITIVVVDDLGTHLDGAEVLLDGVKTEWRSALAVDPGHHVVRAQIAGRTTTREIDVKKGANEKVSLAIDLRRFVPERPVPTWVAAVAGLSVVGFGTFGILGGVTLAKKDELDACRPICDPSERSSLTTPALVADIGLGVGIAALAGAVIGFLIRPTEQRVERVGSEAGGAR